MGYMGFGLQKWIYNLKPRKPFKKGTKGKGYETHEFGNPKEFKLKETGTSNPALAELRLIETRKRIQLNTRIERLFSVLFIIGLIVFFAFMYLGVFDSSKKSKETQKVASTRITNERQYALELLIRSGELNLKNNEIENAINDFILALNIDENNTTVLYNLILALSIDCEMNSRNCVETIQWFEKLKKIDENLISDELEVRIVVAEEKNLTKSKTVAN
jgi:tetratricopeptide (TPR) repeat protein